MTSRDQPAATPVAPVDSPAAGGGKEIHLGTAFVEQLGAGLASGAGRASALRPLLHRALAELGAPHGFVAALATRGDSLELVVAEGAWLPFVGTHFARGQGLVGEAWAGGRELPVGELEAWRAGRNDIPVHGVGQARALPMRAGEECLGVLGFGMPPGRPAAGSEALARGRALAALGGLVLLGDLAVERARAAQQHRQGAEEELSRREQESRELLEVVPALVWLKDRDNRIVRANPAAARCFGLEPAAIEGQYLWDLDPEHAAEAFRGDLQVIAEGEPSLGRHEERSTPQGPRWWRVDRLPRRGPDGQVEGVLVHAHDVSEAERQRELQEHSRAEAARANRQRDRLVGLLRRELGPPSQELLQRVDRLGEAAAGLRAPARRVVEAVHGLLDLARLEAGLLDPELVELDPAALLEDCAELLAARARERGVELVVERGEELPALVLADRLRLQQLFLHLGGCALRELRGDTLRLQLRGRPRGGGSCRLLLQLSTPGGLAPLVEALRSGDARPVGLELVARVAEILGGSLGPCRREQQDQLQLELPAVVAAGGAVPAAPARPAAGSRVLVVEPHAPTAAWFRRELARLGLPDLVVPDAAAALRWLAQGDRPPELLVAEAPLAGHEQLPFLPVEHFGEAPRSGGERLTRPLRRDRLEERLLQRLPRAGGAGGTRPLDGQAFLLLATGGEAAALEAQGARVEACGTVDELLARARGRVFRAALVDGAVAGAGLSRVAGTLHAAAPDGGYLPVFLLAGDVDRAGRERALALGMDGVLGREPTAPELEQLLAPWACPAPGGS